MDLDQDIWQIIFELAFFYEMTIGKARALSSFPLEGEGSGLLITLYFLEEVAIITFHGS